MGKLTENQKENKIKGEVVQAVCCNCNNETNHIVRQSLERETLGVVFKKAGYSYDPHDYLTIDLYDSFQIIQCQGCNSISFRHVRTNSDDLHDQTIFLYPHRTEKSKPIQYYCHLPEKLNQIYHETLNCFNNDYFILCAGGLRAIVEGICADKKIKNGKVLVKEADGTTKMGKDGLPDMKISKQLDGKIAGLVEKGILTQDQANILHAHRFLGNDALHEIQLSRSQVRRVHELSLAIEVVEHIFDTIYEIPKKGDELTRLSENRKESIKKKI
jgi:hypothetical protein